MVSWTNYVNKRLLWPSLNINRVEFFPELPIKILDFAQLSHDLPAHHFSALPAPQTVPFRQFSLKVPHFFQISHELSLELTTE
jgi:hypothetical protein